MAKRVKIVDVHEFERGIYRWSIKLECGHMILRKSEPKNQESVNGCVACDEEYESKMGEKARALVRSRGQEES